MRTTFCSLTRFIKPSRFWQKFGFLGVLAVLAAVIALAQVSTIVFFELDGNAKQDTRDDWQTLLGNNNDGGTVAQGYQPGTFTGIRPDPGVLSSSGTTVTDQTTFTGSNKDTQDTGTWTGGSGSIPPKDDITNAYAAVYTATGGSGHTIIVFGADRFANNGDADLGFWFFKKKTTFSNGAFSPAHSTGDLLVLANFSQTSNFTGTIEVLQWQPACDASNSNKPGSPNFFNVNCISGQPLLILQQPTVATCGGANEPADVCAITNGTTPTQLYWPYAPKSSTTGGNCTNSTNCAPAGSFFEGAIDITAFGDACISSFMPETRSSTSTTATLEDFDGPININTCGISVQKSCPTNTIIHTGSGDTFQYTFGGVINNTGSGTDTNVIVVDSFPANATNITPAGNITCPAGSPTGAVCYSLGSMAGHTCKLWPNNTAINCSTLVSGADPNAAKDFANNTFTSPTNSAQNSASVTSDQISATAVSATCPTQSGSPAINVAKSCSVGITSGLAITVNYKGDVCNESNLTLAVKAAPTDVQLIPTGSGTTATANPTYCSSDTNPCPAADQLSIPFNLNACQALVTSSTSNPLPCTTGQTCSDNGVTCTLDSDCTNPNFPTCSTTGPTGTQKVCMSCTATAAGVCAHYVGSYSPSVASSGPTDGTAGTVCFKDTVTATAESDLFSPAATTSNSNNPAAKCPLCPGGTCN